MTKDMDVQQFEELLGVLKACFEKTSTALMALTGLKYRQGWNQPRQSYGR